VAHETGESARNDRAGEAGGSMRPVLIRQGAGPAAAYRAMAEHLAVLERAREAKETGELQEDEEERERAPKAYGLGDARHLRGIPAIGRGVSGVSPGTAPGDSGRRVSECATILASRDREESRGRRRRRSRGESTY
jgi:hypothetical protein